jgi:hypothetical protein
MRRYLIASLAGCAVALLLAWWLWRPAPVPPDLGYVRADSALAAEQAQALREVRASVARADAASRRAAAASERLVEGLAALDGARREVTETPTALRRELDGLEADSLSARVLAACVGRGAC